MKTNWDLTVFYKDFDDPEFKDDLARLPKEIDALPPLSPRPLRTRSGSSFLWSIRRKRCPAFSSVCR